jgi:hypothetical protein
LKLPMAEVEYKALTAQMTALSKRDKVVVTKVEYTAPYAAYVHENLEVHHNNGQAKYLEEPARAMGPALGKQAAELMRGGMRLEAACRICMLELLRASQELVPVRNGFLKRSGRVVVER